ncbi:serine/threonine-protein kinase [Spirillospora sp. NPDC049652]
MESLGPEDPEKIGPYRVLARLGAGGMGRVYLAETPAGRRLAVKVIRSEHAAEPRFRARFAREVEAARKVNDFYTASVVDADPEAAAPWMATAYVPGPSLQALVAARGALPPERVRELGAGLAEGLAAIHACGLVHRDLKPGNIIVADDGPRIIDFGIARALDASAMTATGAVIGTLAYMSPEQIEADEVGPPSDVFSLGGVLLYAATGHGPFDASSPGAIVHRVVSSDPDLAGVDPFLAGVVARCLTKDPAGRPTPAQLLAELRIVRSPAPPAVPAPPPAVDLRRNAGWEGQPVTVPQRSGAVRRRAILAAGAGTLVAGGAGILGWRALGGEGLPARSATNVFKKATGLGEADPTGGAWTMLEGIDAYELRSAEFSPDGKYMAAAGWTSGPGAHCVGLYDGTSRARLAQVDGGENGANKVAFSPDGRYLAVACVDGKVRIYSVPAGRPVATLSGPKKRAMGVAWSTRGRIAAATQEGGFLWEPSGRLVARLARKDKYSGELYCAAFAPDGRMVATCGADQFVRLYDGVTGARIADLGTPSATGLAFSPDGRTLAVGEYGGTNGNVVRVWDVRTHVELARLPGHKSITSVAFSGDGKRLASGGDDGGSSLQGTIRLWDVATKSQLRLLTTPYHCMSVALSADGTRMLSSGAGKPVLWTGL